MNIYFLIIYLFFGISCSHDEYKLPGYSEHSTTTNGNKINVILLIGDGMGLAQIQAATTVNGNFLNIERCTYVGISKTSSADSYITDSAAGGTALSTGTKTYNGAIGVDVKKNSLITILEIAEAHNLSTGLVSTSAITHATPASFIAHQPRRDDYEAIAKDFLKTEIDVFIGGGKNHFTKRADGIDLTEALRKRGYNVVYDQTALQKITDGKVAALLADEQLPYFSKGRGEMLENSTKKAIELLSKNENGFFLMVEGSQIDWACHANDKENVIAETIDFDKAVKVALDFAENHPNTLVIVTADHETGGLTIIGGNKESNTVDAAFSTKGHSAVMVPVYAYGINAELFAGVYENTAIFNKMLTAYNFADNSTLIKQK